MLCLLAAISAALCACTQAKLNPIDLGRLAVHGQVGQLTSTYKPNANDSEASANARFALEHLRAFFPTGLGFIPRLDPFSRNRPVVVNIKRQDFDCEVTASKIELSGAQKFKLNGLEIYLASDRTDLDLEFPELEMSLDYHVRLHSDDATTEFNGHANMTFKHVVANVAFTVKPMLTNGPIGYFGAIALNLNATADDVQYDLANLHRSRRSVPASKLTKMIVEDIKDDVTTAIINAMMEDLNLILSKYTTVQIMEMLLPKSV